MAAQCWYVARTENGIIRFPPVRVKLHMRTSRHVSRYEIWRTKQCFSRPNSASCAPEITCKVPPMHNDLRVFGLPPGNETVRTGHTLLFNCYNDKPMDGPTEIQCLESGQWSSPFPTCAGVFTFTHWETTTFWSVWLPTPWFWLCVFCQTEFCHAYRLPNNVITSGNQIFPLIARPGNKLTFGCSRSGQFLQGAKQVFCLATGQWSQPFPTCGGKPVWSVCACVRTCTKLALWFLVVV